MVSKKPSVTEQNRRLRKRLKECQQKYDELDVLFKKVCDTVGYDHLANHWDQKSYPNGWVDGWLFPLP